MKNCRTIAIVVCFAQLIFAARAEAQSHGVDDAVRRVDMRVSRLAAGATLAEVQRVLGPPTANRSVGGSSGGDQVMLYVAEPVEVHVTLTSGRVTAIALDLLIIDHTALTGRARLITPMMTRGGLLSFLPDFDDDRRWKESRLDIEQLSYGPAGSRGFSVFLADGVVVDARPGATVPSGLARLTLPKSIADEAAELRIGLDANQAVARLGQPAWEPVRWMLKGEPMMHGTWHDQSIDRYVSLTTAGGVLVGFTIWPFDVKPDWITG
jgi:hypothetical protein